MDSFQVTAKDTSILAESHLVQELQQELYNVDEMFPVLIGEHVGYFHDIDGGFNRDENYHIVNLIHRVQGPDSPPNKIYNDTIEIHLDDWFYHLEVSDICQLTQSRSGQTIEDDYPEGDFVLSLKIDDYMMGRQSFSEALTADIDKREQEFNSNNDR